MQEAGIEVIKEFKKGDFRIENSPLYTLLFLKGDICFSIDGIPYTSNDYTIIFLTPFQVFEIVKGHLHQLILFHGDFYCIEYHKKEVACNGLLFNNIYLTPFIRVDVSLFEELEMISEKMQKLLVKPSNYDEPILKSYLQLVLALCSKEKLNEIALIENNELLLLEDLTFQNELEQFFIEQREVSFYAERLGISVNSLSKKVKKQYGKSPSSMIRERVILEAKKLLHLTTKPIKEIASILNFEDEYYFSRYFKKAVGSSPKNYRESVGISRVAQ